MSSPTERKRECPVAECLNPVRARGWCMKHYQRWRTHGDPTFLVPTRGGVAPIGATYRHHHGYIYQRIETGWQTQHSLVMERRLGRRLLARRERPPCQWRA